MKSEIKAAIEAADNAASSYKLGFEGRRYWLVIHAELQSIQSRLVRAEAFLTRAKEHVVGWTLHDEINEFLAEREG